MIRKLIYMTILLLVFSCSNDSYKNDIDDLVNQKIIEVFSKYDNNLWHTFEKEFFVRIKKVGAFDNTTDTIEAIHIFNLTIISKGYPKEFYVDRTNGETMILLLNLKAIGYEKEDESAHKFLFNLVSPIVLKFESENNKQLDSTNYIKSYTFKNPNTIKISYDLEIFNLEKGLNLEELWKKEGTRKMLILFYMSRMINKIKPQY